MVKLVGALVVIALIFGAGWVVGGGHGVSSGQEELREQVYACLPVADRAALDACLGGRP